jgi:Sulfotransferase domain
VLEVIGVGFGRTGTLSLKLALERLGHGPCHHMIELIDNAEQLEFWRQAAEAETADWDVVYHGYRATVDWPGVHFWRQLTAHFPEAKVILTTRDPRQWWESAHESIFQVLSMTPSDESAAKHRDLVSRLVWQGDFGGRFEDAGHAIAVFNEHNEAVRRQIPADRLLEFQVSQGWGPLCDFLGAPVPDEPFPRSNDRREFAARIAERARGGEGDG